MKTTAQLLGIIFTLFLILILVGRTPQNPGCLPLRRTKVWHYDTSRNASTYFDLGIRLLPEMLCNPVTLLVIVHSSPTNVEVRNTIRQSWGKHPRQDALVFFILGTRPDSNLQMEILKESEEFGDIIQADFVDVYANLTIKSIIMLNLALHCDHSFKYLLKTDDDTLLNLDSTMRMLSRDGSPDLLMGHLFCFANPDRNPCSKWYAPYWLYEYDKYPSYLSGGGYVMSWDVAQMILLQVWSTPLYHMEDVYLTGICARRAELKPKHSELFAKKGAVYARGECFLKEAYAVYDVTVKEMKEWNSMLKDERWERKCKGFSSAKWVFGSVFKGWDNLFSYRRTCK